MTLSVQSFAFLYAIPRFFANIDCFITAYKSRKKVSNNFSE